MDKEASHPNLSPVTFDIYGDAVNSNESGEATTEDQPRHNEYDQIYPEPPGCGLSSPSLV